MQRLPVLSHCISQETNNVFQTCPPPSPSPVRVKVRLRIRARIGLALVLGLRFGRVQVRLRV